jgi:tetratricopeptide (TPR) repeat protein
MTGKLSEHPLAELLREIVAEGLSGSLRLEQERIKTVIYFDAGRVVYATSNLRPHRLAEALRRWRVISEAQFAALPEGDKSDAETGRLLIERGALTKEALEELRSRLMADVLRPALLWTQGVWSFDARVRLTGDVRAHVELPELLMEAARRLPAKLASFRFSNRNERLLPVTGGANDLELLPKEAFVLSRIDMPLRVYELLAISALPEEETLHACYALALGGMIEREAWPRAFTPEEVSKALETNAAARQSASSESVPTVEVKKSEEAPKAVEPEVDEKRELEELFERLSHATNHYQVLGISRNANQDTLKQTYYTLARRFHPDRFHQDEEIHRRVEDAFARIARAYETLRDKSARAAYDLKIEKEKSARPSGFSQAKSEAKPSQSSTPSTAASATELAEESFQRGLTAQKTGKMVVALNSFAEAARLEPNVARYRAQYGQALAANEQMRHRAEVEFQAAILLEPANTAYRIMLARLYRSLGFIKRAQGEIERVRSIDPRNAEALALLAELQSTQGTR